VRLRVNVLDALMQQQGVQSVAGQAERVGVNRSTLFRLRNGETVPSVDLAMRIAAAAGTTVEVLFERVTADV
jgi:DNA-binding XRE family transcriptional regulator